jgi:hypothetical protein
MTCFPPPQPAELPRRTPEGVGLDADAPPPIGSGTATAT